MTPWKSFHLDLLAADAVLDRLGLLTEAVFGAISEWFVDVYINLPIAEMPLTEEERVSLLKAVIGEMADAVAVYNDEDELTDEQAEALCDAVNPLWKEIASLEAQRLNAFWESVKPHSEEERSELIESVESVLGMDRYELAQAAIEDEELRVSLIQMGLRVEDLT